MTKHTDDAPGRRGFLLCALVVLAIIATVVVAVLAYRQSPGAPPRGSEALPSQAAEQSGAVPH
ncbi:MAG TPA: hypothetical protein VF649_13575 [Sphingomonas sp.]|jgi:hypothetical protein|uniref:hypothetical protein n=1 Tax=Sphingomonas sp. TaxID=28214 RepID=UPI002ED86096